MTRWAATTLMGLVTLTACSSTPPPPSPTPRPAMGTISGRYIPCTSLGEHTGLTIEAVVDGKVRASTVTDDQGRYRFDLPAGQYELSVEHSVLASVTVQSGVATRYSQTWGCA